MNDESRLVVSDNRGCPSPRSPIPQSPPDRPTPSASSGFHSKFTVTLEARAGEPVQPRCRRRPGGRREGRLSSPEISRRYFEPLQAASSRGMPRTARAAVRAREHRRRHPSRPDGRAMRALIRLALADGAPLALVPEPGSGTGRLLARAPGRRRARLSGGQGPRGRRRRDGRRPLHGPALADLGKPGFNASVDHIRDGLQAAGVSIRASRNSARAGTGWDYQTGYAVVRGHRRSAACRESATACRSASTRSRRPASIEAPLVDVGAGTPGGLRGQGRRKAPSCSGSRRGGAAVAAGGQGSAARSGVDLDGDRAYIRPERSGDSSRSPISGTSSSGAASRMTRPRRRSASRRACARRRRCANG